MRINVFARTLVGLSATASVAAADAHKHNLGVYIFHRHGDRTAKAWEPVNLTALGADQVHESGRFYNERYTSSTASIPVAGLSADVAVLSQLSITSPEDAVLHNSALSFLQGLYPPTDASETLADGSKVEAPLDGYQYIPVDAVSDTASHDNAESSTWLQGSSGCSNAEISSNNYFASPEYRSMLTDSNDFYRSLGPVVSSTFAEDELNFQNAYEIYDLINVATIHNSSIPSDSLLTNSTLSRLFNYASVQQWNLAYNESDPVRAISGAILGGQIVDALEAIVDRSNSATPMNVQFGSYGTFMSFFGLAQLHKTNPELKNIVNYASSFVIELVTNATDPALDDIKVQFSFANGTAADDTLTPYPLFGQDDYLLPWNEWKSRMMEFSIKDDSHWCDLCGESDGKCSSSGASGQSSNSTSDDDSGISRTVAGVIGALVTLAVVLGLEAAFMLIGGFRLVKKSTLAAAARPAADPSGAKA